MVFYIHTKYTKIYTRYIQNTKRRRGRPARPGPEARAPVRPVRGPGLGPGWAGQPATADYFVYILYIFCIYFCIFCMYIKYHKMAIVMAYLNCYGIPNLLVRFLKYLTRPRHKGWESEANGSQPILVHFILRNKQSNQLKIQHINAAALRT